jgi:hypothetical protein
MCCCENLERSFFTLHLIYLFLAAIMAASSSAIATANVINLKGSTDIVTEFFNYSVNNILYQRGVYPPETFKRVSQYGLSMMVSTDDALVSYLSNILKQLEGTFICFLAFY